MPDEPCSHLASGKWPDGPLQATAPAEAVLIRQICQTLKRVQQSEGLSTHQLARRLKIAPSTVADLLSGTTWGTFRTIAALEIGLGVGLWPAERTLLEPAPCRYLEEGGTWPAGPFKAKPPSEVRLAKIICERFEAAVNARLEMSIDKAAAEARVPLVVVQEFASGRRWPDLSTVSRLERALGTMLWVKGTSEN